MNTALGRSSPLHAHSDDRSMRTSTGATRMTAWLTIVGIGEDGLAGLGEEARRAIAEAQVLFGGERHLALVPERTGQERTALAEPLQRCLRSPAGPSRHPVCVLASGDPMFFGIGGSLSARASAPDEMRILPCPVLGLARGGPHGLAAAGHARRSGPWSAARAGQSLSRARARGCWSSRPMARPRPDSPRC